MKVLLCKSIEKVGIVGDVVDVAAGYARNYLLPQALATEPTEANLRALAEARRAAEEERTRQHAELEALAEQIRNVEVTIRARANEEGVLYGSVGAREIVDALAEEGFYLKTSHVALERPIRQLDNISVDLRLADDVHSSIKVWVVREKTQTGEESDAEASEDSQAGMEAGADDNSNHD